MQDSNLDSLILTILKPAKSETRSHLFYEQCDDCKLKVKSINAIQTYLIWNKTNLAKQNFKLLWKYWSFFPYHKTLLQILYFLSFGLLTNCAKHLNYYLLRSKADLCWPREIFNFSFVTLQFVFSFSFIMSLNKTKNN